jgi:hypothetical protein
VLRLRLPFAALYVAAQLWLMATAGHRAGHAFGFRMFNEASMMRIELRRRVRSDGGVVEVPVVDGAWTARDGRGRPHVLVWRDLVGPFGPATLDATVKAHYGAETQLGALQAALDWVAAHAVDDAETVAWLADVTTQTNGHPPARVHLESRRP